MKETTSKTNKSGRRFDEETQRDAVKMLSSKLVMGQASAISVFSG
jgi:hypothetical protein